MAPSVESESTKKAELSDFVLKDIEGKSVTLSDYLGDKVVVIYFWSTCCDPCKRQLVHLQDLHTRYKEQGLELLTISMDEPETHGAVRPYIAQRGYTFPVLLDTESIVTNQFNPRRSSPFTLVINRDQKITWTHASYVPGDEKQLEAEILEALGGVGKDIE